MKVLKEVNREYITQHWDNISLFRKRQLLNGEDNSYLNILMPYIIDSVDQYNCTNVLDAGCGIGIITNSLSKKVSRIDGIDCSSKSIEIASAYCKGISNIHFDIAYIEDYKPQHNYTLVISNMVLMDLINLDSVIKNISQILDDDGVFIFTITHPCYWPIYWKYYQKSWFDYHKEIIIENNFDISSEKSKYKTVHIHRPIEQYVKVLGMNNFYILEMNELLGPQFNLPKFLSFKCKKK